MDQIGAGEQTGSDVCWSVFAHVGSVQLRKALLFCA